jgi:hypothetical protein
LRPEADMSHRGLIERPEWVESGRLVIGHTGKAARRLCPTSLLCNVGSSYSEEPGVEIL